MIKIENWKVEGFEPAIRGMRNPMNSWAMSDSVKCVIEENEGCRGCPLYSETDDYDDPCAVDGSDYAIGPKDLDLCMRLNAGGPVHAKYRRMITVWCDITAPLYWWKEFDTYKVGTVANSCSTMHKIHAKEFELSDFSYEYLINMEEIVKSDTPDEEKIKALVFNDNPIVETDYGSYWSPKGILKLTILMLNKCRKLYLDTKDKKYWWQMIQLLPSSYNQRRTVMLNYEVLHGIYNSRKDHKLDCWHRFCDWIKELPYSDLITE